MLSLTVSISVDTLFGFRIVFVENRLSFTASRTFCWRLDLAKSEPSPFEPWRDLEYCSAVSPFMCCHPSLKEIVWTL